MSRNNPRGFVEINSRPESAHFVRRFKRKADGAAAATEIRAGDPVTAVSGHSVQRMSNTATAASLPLLGVVRAVYNSNGRPFTHNLPTSRLAIPASTAGEVDVNTDPSQLYLASTDATVVSTLIGQFVDVTANVAGTAAGRSGFAIEVSGAANTAAPNRPFQVIQIAPNNLDGITGGENNQDVVVRIANHAFNLWAPSSGTAFEPKIR